MLWGSTRKVACQVTQRIKGQEVEIVALVNGAPQTSLSFARSIEFAFKVDMLQEGYLGETTDRYDAVFRGIRGRVEFHFNGFGPFLLTQQLIDKARRREAGTRVNMKATLRFPSGSRARVLFRDVEFGELPFSFGSRSDYGTFQIEWGASDGQILPVVGAPASAAI